MKVGILAGGLGTRLAEETEVRPKPMVEIGGRPILWHIMRHYLRYGFDHFVIALGYKGEVIKRYVVDYSTYSDSNLTVDMHNGTVEAVMTTEPVSESWTVDLIETGTSSETGARIKRLAPHLNGSTFMLTYGDGLSDVDLRQLLQFHRAHGRLVTMTVVHPPARFGKVEIEGDAVVRFTEKPQFAGEFGPQVGEGWINGGFFVMEPGALDYIDDDPSTKWELGPLEGLAKDGELMAYRHASFWQCMDTLRDRKMLESLWDHGNPPWTI
ncbi:MAG TPA: glucose-1-phosphate cytidylyltransferase [Actinomycetota bacterium]|jgi:glucose-1-phosphate cytidylyltransferase